VAKGKIYRALGLMSGTSLDGVDAALMKTDGENFLRLGSAISVPYTAAQRRDLKSAIDEALIWQFEGPQPKSFAKANEILHNAHETAVRELCKRAGASLEELDLIGFHGQTVLHRPPSRGRKGQTLQIGDGARLAQALNVDVAYDFRSADVAAGGQGAPLAPIYHKALLQASGFEHAAVLNIGGVSNYTLIGPDGALAASDCGPGNGPLDQWINQNGLGEFDKDGRLSLSGTPDFARIEGWLRGGFFSAPVPKSADRYDFDVLPRMHGLSPEDGAATLSAFCAMGSARTLKQSGAKVDTLFVCGGGRKNRAIMAALSEACDVRVLSAEAVGWDGDALEAQAFAYLAVRTRKRLPISFPGTTASPQPMTGGIIAAGDA
jgi:anhydro-N-acetylmuramic acid kinase